jgi:hypothetical protein
MQHVDQKTLDAVINHSLTEAQVARIKEHVRVCRVCARRLEEYRDLFSEVEVIIPTAERDVIPKPAPTQTWREVIRPRLDDALPSGDTAIKIGAAIVTVLVIAVVIYLVRGPTQSATPIVLQPVSRGVTGSPPRVVAPVPATDSVPARTTASLGSATPARVDPPKKPVQTVPSAATSPASRRQPSETVPKPAPAQGKSAAPTPTPAVEGGHTPLFHRVESTEAIGALGGSMRLIDGETPDHFELAPGNVVPGAAENLPVVRVIYRLNGSTILLDQQRHPEIASKDMSSGTAPEGVSVVQWSEGDFWLTLAGRVPADTLELLARRVR